MTDDGAGNPRFAFIPKRAWDVLLDVAPVPLAGIAIWFSVWSVADLVRHHVTEIASLGPIAEVFGGSELFPTAIAIGTALYFLLDILLRRRERSGALDHKGFGRSRLLLASATIVVALLAAYWCLDAMHGWQVFRFCTCSPAASVGIGGAWALAAVTALGLRHFGNRFEVICLLPPIACLVAALLNAMDSAPFDQVAVIAAALLPGGQCSFTTTPGLLVLVTTCLTVCVLPAALWAERRLFQSSQRAIGIACASLWVLAAAMACWLLPSKLPRIIGLRSCLEPDSNAELYFALGIAGAFVLAACIRAWVFYRRRAAMAPQAKLADN